MIADSASRRPMWMSNVKRVVVWLISLILWPLVTLLERAGVRFLVGAHVLSRIGHTSLVPDVYIKTALLGWRPTHRNVLLAPPSALANPALVRCWRRHLRVVTNPWLVALLRPLEWQTRLRCDLSRQSLSDGRQVKPIPAIFPVQRAYEAKFGDRPLLTLSESEEAQGRVRLRQLGIPEGAWFVCLHVREEGYLPELAYHAYRNSDIRTYLPAVEAIVQRGGWVIRMGDASMSPLPRMKHVVDYVHSGLQSDWMDIFCFARCRFFLGDTSGPFAVSFVFGVPCALANFTPLGHPVFGARNLWIPKRYHSVREAREMTFSELLHSPARLFCRTEEYEAAGLSWIDNTPDNIRDMTLEMLERLGGVFRYAEQDEQLQRRFHELLALDPLWTTTSRVGRDFLRRHAWLLEGPVVSAGSAPGPAKTVLTGPLGLNGQSNAPSCHEHVLRG